ncbi:hypothetical protein RD792_015317 [Penstemon davidsonii]|uniref:Uncharacterized protein n=1 Tax=Penstemon davidsonii TaxID=160366 RepID=A0ABR0CRV1_9LAMI|nr:hypothetical protein RD792_015317 [Penstemon davidsonii]
MSLVGQCELLSSEILIFFIQTSSKTISKLTHTNAPLGYSLCFLNLAFDGFTNATQDSNYIQVPKTSARNIMLGMNLWGTIYNMILCSAGQVPWDMKQFNSA